MTAVPSNTTSDTAPGRRTGVHGRGRELLLAAAGELFGERGYAGTSTRDIAERAGVTEPMLFRHFGTKANLFQQSAVTPFVEFMLAYVADYRAREQGRLSTEDAGRRLYEGLFAALREQREPLMALLSAGRFAPVADEVSAQVQEAFAQVISLFEEVVVTGSAEHGFTDPDLPATVRVMFGMVLSAALHDDWMALGGGPGAADPDDRGAGRAAEDRERIVAAMTRMAVRGLGAR